MKVPTVALTHPELAISYPDIPDSAPESLLTLQFRPSFDKPLAIPQRTKRAPFSITSWQVRIPAERVDYNDSLDVPGVITTFKPKWTIAGVANSILVRQPNAPPYPVSQKPVGWDDASRNEQIQFVVSIDKTDLEALPEYQPIDVLRGTDRVGRLPNLWSWLLPTRLTAKYISPTQFSLQGENAGAIDAVSVQGPGAPSTVLTSASGEDFALITLPTASKTSNTPATKPSINALKPATGNEGTPVVITGTGLATAGKVQFGDVSATSACWNSVSIGVNVPAGLKAGDVDVTRDFVERHEDRKPKIQSD